MTEERDRTIREWKRRYEHEIIQEDDPRLHGQVHQGDFASGIAWAPRHRKSDLRRRLARGRKRPDAGNPNEGAVAV
jgi:hypothetical protein